MRVLLVKLTSLGDVVHNLPVASDLARAFPGIEIDWVVEAPYAEIVKLHPAISNVFPVSLRNLKKNLTSVDAWREFNVGRANLKRQSYDLIIDTQGLLKSAWIAHWATGPVAGFSKASAREPASARFYQNTFEVPRDWHAVERNRGLASQAAGYALPQEVDYGIFPPTTALAWLPVEPYVTMLHATSRQDKSWPIDSWVELGLLLEEQGIRVVIPAGSAAERKISEEIARRIPNSVVAPTMTLSEAAILLAQSRATVGVDTGLSHLSVALGRPTVGIYVSTSPQLTGLYGNGDAVNIGGGTTQQPNVPRVREVLSALPRFVGSE